MLQKMLAGLIHTGRLVVQLPEGRSFEVGEKRPTRGPDVSVRLDGRWTPLKLVLNPELHLGEAYMNGELIFERGSLWDLMELVGRNTPSQPPGRARRIARAMLHRLQRPNSPRRAKRNVAHHYDLSHALYRTFLDEDLQYSCAYFRTRDLSLDEAQKAKVRHIAAKLRLEPGQHVLDIGCGWGGLAVAIARASDVEVTGITLSKEQLEVCRQRAHDAGLDGQVRFQLRDYRHLDGVFDRIVSVGMFEHVGAAAYPAFFETLQRLLAVDGTALVHSIGTKDEPSRNNPWMEKHIFPGGHIPALSEVATVVQRTGLWITDLEVLRLHYAETLRCWRERFLSQAPAVRELYDDRFVRMWEFYLASCEMSFRFGGLMVMQVQLAKQVDAVPCTRDYMVDTERAWDQPEAAEVPRALKVQAESEIQTRRRSA